MDALITNVGLMCRHLTTLGCTILLTNIPTTIAHSSSSSGSARSSSSSSSSGSGSGGGAGGSLGVNVKPLQEGAMSASLSDLFDAIVTVATTPILANTGTLQSPLPLTHPPSPLNPPAPLLYPSPHTTSLPIS